MFRKVKLGVKDWVSLVIWKGIFGKIKQKGKEFFGPKLNMDLLFQQLPNFHPNDKYQDLNRKSR